VERNRSRAKNRLLIVLLKTGERKNKTCSQIEDVEETVNGGDRKNKVITAQKQFNEKKRGPATGAEAGTRGKGICKDEMGDTKFQQRNNNNTKAIPTAGGEE